MTLGGWIIMSLSVGAVVILFLWCVCKVITHPTTTSKMHGLDEIDTGEDV